MEVREEWKGVNRSQGGLGKKKEKRERKKKKKTQRKKRRIGQGQAFWEICQIAMGRRVGMNTKGKGPLIQWRYNTGPGIHWAWAITWACKHWAWNSHDINDSRTRELAAGINK
jgi:hypothetical protein